VAGKWTKVGTIMKNKKNTGNYLKVVEKVVLEKDQILNIQNPRKRPGITEEQLAKIPDFVVAEVYIPPAREQ
jgi:hypothetical protein